MYTTGPFLSAPRLNLERPGGSLNPLGPFGKFASNPTWFPPTNLGRIPGGEALSRVGNPSGRSLFTMGSPISRIGRMKRTLAQHFGGIRNVPLEVMLLLADSKAFRINNTVLKRGVEGGFVREKGKFKTKRGELSWAMSMIASRFSNDDLRQAALDRYENTAKHYWDMINQPLLDEKSVMDSYLSARDYSLRSARPSSGSVMKSVRKALAANLSEFEGPFELSARIFLGNRPL